MAEVAVIHPFPCLLQGGGGHHGAALQDADLWRPTAWLRWEEEHVHSTSTANWKRQGWSFSNI